MPRFLHSQLDDIRDRDQYLKGSTSFETARIGDVILLSRLLSRKRRLLAHRNKRGKETS